MDTKPREPEAEGVTDRPVKPLVAIEQPHGRMEPSNPSNMQLEGEKSNPREVHEKLDQKVRSQEERFRTSCIVTRSMALFMVQNIKKRFIRN